MHRQLLKSGLVGKAALEKALALQREKGGNLGEILVQYGEISESQLLQFLAKEFDVLFIGSEKLANMTIPADVVGKVPGTLAREKNILPLQLRGKDNTLFLAIDNPVDLTAIDEVQFSSGIQKIKPVICMSKAIRQAIDRIYGEGDDEAQISLGGIEHNDDGSISIDMGSMDDDAPMELDRASDRKAEPKKFEEEPTEELELIGEVDEPHHEEDDSDSIDLGLDGKPLDAGAATPDETLNLQAERSHAEEEEEEIVIMPEEEAQPAPPPAKPAAKSEETKKEAPKVLLIEPHAKIGRFLQRLMKVEGYQATVLSKSENAPTVLQQGEYDSLIVADKSLTSRAEFELAVRAASPKVNLSILPSYSTALTGKSDQYHRIKDAFTETLDVMVGLLEMSKGAFRGHTHLVVKYSRLIASKVGLSGAEFDAIIIAAHLHDLGMPVEMHRTLFTFDPDLEMDYIEAPLKILSSVKFPTGVKEILLHRFERWDGKGSPEGFAKEAIPVGSRILSVVDAYQEMIVDIGGQKGVDRDVAMQQILKAGGELFDPDMVQLLLKVMEDEIKLGKIEGSAERIVIIDPDSQQATLIGMKFVNGGYKVDVFHSGEEALESVLAQPPDFVISETALGGISGFELCEKLKANEATRDVPLAFIGSEDDPQDVTRALELGAEDFISKPFKIDILFAKATRILERTRKVSDGPAKTEGVSGNLKEMALPDMIQILTAGRKTGRIDLINGSDTAQVFIEDGRIVNCVFGQEKGDEAFYKVVVWSEGSFTIVPNVEIEERLIDKPNDNLILEGFRRMDESMRDSDDDDDEIKMDGEFL